MLIYIVPRIVLGRDVFEGFLGKSKACWGLTYRRPYFLLCLKARENMTFENFDRITQDPNVMGGKPCIRGMRLTVG